MKHKIITWIINWVIPMALGFFCGWHILDWFLK
jgi:hypothetical protein